MNLKKLHEERAALCSEMQNLINSANTEQRAMSEDEQKKFDELEGKVKAIDATIRAEERARNLMNNQPAAPKNNEPTVEERAASEERAFAAYIRGYVETRAGEADVNLTSGDNGAVIPSSIANKIIEKVIDMCPIYQMADRYNVKGTLSIPYYNEEEQKIEMAYADEFGELTSTSGKFSSIELKGYLAAALTKVSKSLVNNSNFDLVNFVIRKMAEAVALFIEHECLIGTNEKTDGISKAANIVNAASATAITADELIDLQETVPDVYQSGCIWIMNKSTRTAIRKLKDSDGNYILNKDMTAKWGYTLFGQPVYCSDAMPKIGAGAKSIVYGDMTGLAVKVSEEMNIEVLREKFATQHALGVVAWIEMDAKIQNQQKIAVLKQAS